MDRGGDERDGGGRFVPDASGNPGGRPARRDFARLLQAAERVGAVVTVPTRRARRGSDGAAVPAGAGG